MNRLVRVCLVLSTVEMLALDGFLLWAELSPTTHSHGLATLLLFTSYLPLLLLLAAWRRLGQDAAAMSATMPSWACPALRIVTIAITLGYATLWFFAARLFA